MSETRAFGRCNNCMKIRWLTPEYMARYGHRCDYCNSNAVRGAKKLNPFERLKIARLAVWQLCVENADWKWHLPTVAWYFVRNLVPQKGPSNG